MDMQNDLTGNMSNAAPEANKKKSCLVGCLIIGGIFAVVTAAVVGYLIYKTNDLVKDLTSEVTAELEKAGFKPMGESFAGKGITDLGEVFGQKLTIDKAPAQKVFGAGAALDINADCGYDVLFCGSNCNVNANVAANLCFYGQKGSKLTIAAGVKVKKLYVAEEVQVINNGEITEGTSHMFDEVFDFTGMLERFKAKHGEVPGVDKDKLKTLESAASENKAPALEAPAAK